MKAYATRILVEKGEIKEKLKICILPDIVNGILVSLFGTANIDYNWIALRYSRSEFIFIHTVYAGFAMSTSKIVLCSSRLSDRVWRVLELKVIKLSPVARLIVISVGVKTKQYIYSLVVA